jgi:hypothetical protein
MATVVLSHHYNTAGSEAYVQELESQSAATYVGKEGELFYDPTTSVLRISNGSTAGGVTVGGAPAAVGCITMGESPTWSGTSGYTVTKSGGDGQPSNADVTFRLTFPSAYSARTDYIVHVTYDGTTYVVGNGAQVAVNRSTAYVDIVPRKWNEDPLIVGELMVTIHNL